MVNGNSSQFDSSVRNIKITVSLLQGDTVIKTFTENDYLKDFQIDRAGDSSKFFGYGIIQKLSLKLVDIKRELTVTTANSIKVLINGVDNLPLFFVSECRRDEKSNELSITAYDGLYRASEASVSELSTFGGSYTLKQFADAAAQSLGLVLSVNDAAFNLEYPTGANFEGTETLREALDDVAEATQTIYFVTGKKLFFKVLDKTKAAVFTIARAKYFDLKNSDNRRLATLVSASELGDNISVTTGLSGSTQYIRDNAFWTLREDINELLNAALLRVENLTLAQFNCSWRGNPLLELGDCIKLETKDGNFITGYMLNDSLTYNGSLAENTSWKYQEQEETASNPASLGDALKQTFARVDKVNKQIDIVASETKANTEAISGLQITTNEISASVTEVQNNTDKALEGVNEDLVNLRNEVNTKIDSESVNIEIKKAIDNGVDKVETQTGFTFNEEGLTVSKSDKEMKTTITEDGMTVKKANTPVLTANNEGVRAEDLHATTYLIIGNNSRFEDFGFNRTGCFWIGG